MLFSESENYLFLICVKNHYFKGTYFQLSTYLSFLGNILKDFTLENMIKLDCMNMCMVFFDYDSIGADDILDIHKYLTKRKSVT